MYFFKNNFKFWIGFGLPEHNWPKKLCKKIANIYFSQWVIKKLATYLESSLQDLSKNVFKKKNFGHFGSHNSKITHFAMKNLPKSAQILSFFNFFFRQYWVSVCACPSTVLIFYSVFIFACEITYAASHHRYNIVIHVAHALK